jgi:LysR family transcriptional activator of glutamate synthase operon
MNLNQLYYFKTVAKLQHFRQAANELNVSQPSLSLAISNLEKDLGTYLFERQGRNVTLTKYGKLYLEYVEEALSILEVGEKKLRQITSETEGHIDIAYIYPLAPYFIPKKVRSFLELEKNKDITFSFRQGITSDLIKGLKDSKYDVVFCSYVENEEDMETSVYRTAYPDHDFNHITDYIGSGSGNTVLDGILRESRIY